MILTTYYISPAIFNFILFLCYASYMQGNILIYAAQYGQFIFYVIIQLFCEEHLLEFHST